MFTYVLTNSYLNTGKALSFLLTLCEAANISVPIVQVRTQT